MNQSPAPQLIYDLDQPAMVDLLNGLGQPRFRADQIWHGIYQKYWNDPSKFVGLPNAIRNTLPDVLRFSSLKVARELHSRDKQTHKYLFELPDGRFIETVWMQYRERNTLCISTQSGCAMGCAFCATGQMGFFRNLSSGEIVEQVIYFARELQLRDEQVTNIVFMGMGEPFHNYENVLAAVDRLNDDKGFNFGARRMTISTVGLVPQIRRFAEEKRQVNLAVSLHAADDAVRSNMMPVNKKYPIDQVIEACHYYVQLTHRRITFEWALIDDVNDSDATAQALAHRLKGLLCHVNLIPLNPTQKYSGRATGGDRMNSFKAVLESYGIPCSIRLRRGIDIKAGCGQLASEPTRQTEES
jgi:23S rRNA (adenine2503-C2)-methyltransferase